MRKVILTLMLAIATTICARQIGTWQVFPSYYVATQNVAAGNIIYSVTDGNLMSYNTKDTEVRLYDKISHLNDIAISRIAYSKEAKTLAILYANNNLDLMDENENVVNMPALRDKNISGKEVSDIYVCGSTLYLSTGFGIVEVDMRECVFRNTYRINMTTTAVAANDTHLFLATTEGIFQCSKQKDMHMKDNWEKISGSTDIQRMAWFDGKLYLYQMWNIIAVDVEKKSNILVCSGTYDFFSYTGDQILWGKADKIYTLSKGGTQTEATMNNTWKDVSCTGNIYWVSDNTNGLRGYKNVDGKYEPCTSPIQPNSPKHDYSYRVKWVGERLLVTGGINTTDNVYMDPTAMYYEDGKWTIFEELTNPDPDIYPKLTLRNTTHLVQDPNDPTHHYASLHRNGLCEYRNGKFVKLWNCDNSPLTSILELSSRKLNFVSCTGLTYDADGNLWMLNSENDTIVRVLKNNGKWAALHYDEIEQTSLCDDYLIHSSGIVALNCRWQPQGSGHKGFFFIDTKGTLDNVKDDRHILRSTIINQDNTPYEPEYFYGMKEDLDGRVWLATDKGLFVIDDIEQVFDKNFRFTQIKINRNDGSGLADYLLSGVSISCIAVDGGNRKWVGTYNNGIFLISADGQEELQHFMAEDSPLLSNTIYDIDVCPSTGEVAIATDKGLCSYMSDATEAADGLDKENIECFPNPVRSDYHGPIVVRGLAMDTEVKIISTGGQLVWSGRSIGGVFTWNGCNKSGARVPSGIYHIVANNSEGNKAIVTRIIVIN